MTTVRRVIVVAGAAGLGRAGGGVGARRTPGEDRRAGKEDPHLRKDALQLTNTRPLDQFIAMYGSNGRFLHGPFSRFFRDELLAFFRCHAWKPKRSGGRVFRSTTPTM